MKRSMKTRLVAIFVVTIVIIIGVISLANVVLLPYFYQSNKVSQMQGVYSRVINICKMWIGIRWTASKKIQFMIS